MNVGRLSPCIFPRIALAFCLCLPFGARAATLTVTSTADNGAGSLRNTIASANPGDTIVFNSPLSGQMIQLTSAEILVSKNLTIDASGLAAGIAINGNHNFRVLEISNNATLTLNSVTATNGYVTNQFFPVIFVGGILVNTGAVLTANNCTVTGCSNSFSGYAGGIGAFGTATLNHCTVSGNYAGFGNSAGIFCSNAAVTLNSCTVSGNFNGQQGCGIGCYGGSLALTNCVVSNNTNRGPGGNGGGGIWMSGGGTLNLNACTISGNYMTNLSGGGGGLYLLNGAVGTLVGCTFSGNTVLGSSPGGGGIDNGGTLTLINCTVSGNLAGSTSFSGYGGGIANAGTLTLLNCTVSANTSGQTAGGINAGTSLIMTNTVVAGNRLLTPFPPFNSVDIAGGYSGTSNFVGGAPALAALGNYGGPTLTMPPLPDSPLIDGGSDSVTNSLVTDQRGAGRFSGAHVDIGAVELQQSMVMNANDSGADSLRAVVAGGPDLVLFTNTLSGQTIHLSSGELLLGAANIGIDASTLAAPVVIDAGHAGRILEVSAGHVVLNSLTLTNGYLTGGAFPSESGGAILVDSGAALTVNNCTLSGNSAVSDFGGALVAQSTGIVALNNCIFSGNASEYGGGIYNSGGGMTLSNCVFAGNTASGYSGAFENDGTMVLYNCTLSSNSSVTGGGAIQNGGFLTLNNCTFFGNSTAGTGGAIENDSSVALNNCTISGNSANSSQGGGLYNTSTAVLTNTIVAGNTAAVGPPDIAGSYSGVSDFVGGSPQLSAFGSYGGPTPTMPPLAGSPVINAGTDAVTNFLATDERGYPRRVGGHVDIGAAEFQSPLLVTNYADGLAGSLRALITRADAGGVITFSNNVGSLQLTNGELAIGKSLTIDGAPFRMTISAQPSTRLLEITGGNVILKSLYLQLGHAIGTGFPTNCGGCALVDPGASLSASNCIISGNTATNGGGIFNLGTVALTNCTISSDMAAFGAGGGIFNLGTLTLNNCGITGDSASGGYGGGIFNSNGIITLNGCTFSTDFAPHGGGICNSNGTATLNNCTLAQNNAASGFGGGIENDSSLTLNNCTLSANYAGSTNGGGIYNSPSGAVLVMTNTIVAGNSGFPGADISGSYSGVNNFVGSPPSLSGLGNYGGLTQTMPPAAGSPVIDAGTDVVTSFLTNDQRGLPRLAGAHVDIGAAELQPNPVITAADTIPGSLRYAITYAAPGGVITFSSSLGGQYIHLTNGELALSKNLTIDASGLAGGLGIDAGNASRVFEITNASVTLNGLGIYGGYVTGSYPANAGGGILVDSDATLTLNTAAISGDSAVYGGGLFNLGTVVINYCAFAGNSANNGGGLYNFGTSATVNNSTFTGNSGGVGGGIENDGPLTLNGCTITANTGGGMENDGPLALTNSTVAANTGSGIYDIYSGTTRLINCTFANNSGGGIDIDLSAGPVGLTNTIAAENTGFDVSGAYSGSSNFISGNPGLAPLGSWGGPTQTMPPMFGSPVIDAGLDSVSTFLSADQRGYARLSGAHVDIGAVEAQVVPAANAPVLSGTLLTNGFQLNFTTVSADFTAITSTNVALPLSNWTVLGNVSGISSGQYQFTDMAATNDQQFYEVVSP